MRLYRSSEEVRSCAEGREEKPRRSERPRPRKDNRESFGRVGGAQGRPGARARRDPIGSKPTPRYLLVSGAGQELRARADDGGLCGVCGFVAFD